MAVSSQNRKKKPTKAGNYLTAANAGTKPPQQPPIKPSYAAVNQKPPGNTKPPSYAGLASAAKPPGGKPGISPPPQQTRGAAMLPGDFQMPQNDLPDTALLSPRGVGGPGYQTILPPEAPPEQTTQPTGPRTEGQAQPSPVQRGFQYQDRTTGGFSPVGSHSASAAQQQVQDNQLVRNQLEGLLDWDSVYMDRARQQGIDRASARGLGNSSIAAGNAMGAAIDRSLPIASADASRYGQVANLNQQATNTMRNANANRGLQAATFNQQQQLARDQFRHGQQMDVWASGRADRQLDAQQWQGMFGQYMNSINSIYANPNISGEQANAAVENLRQTMPGFANDAWGAIPPGLLGGNSVPNAQMMPPMPPIVPGLGG